MKIVKVSDVKMRDDSSNPIFRGKVEIQELVTSLQGFRVTQVNFSPGARNIMHAHTFDQVLYVTEGKGILADEKTETVVTPGTLIFIPAGEKHWHGAVAASRFAHIAVMPPGETKY
jgi:quercetin dioxygenase-like cupin family protein